MIPRKIAFSEAPIARRTARVANPHRKERPKGSTTGRANPTGGEAARGGRQTGEETPPLPKRIQNRSRAVTAKSNGREIRPWRTKTTFCAGTCFGRRGGGRDLW